MAIHIYKPVYSKVDFLKDQEPKFLSWICPLLKIRVASSYEYIYYEGDELNRMYFLKHGTCDYVLPKYSNQAYVRIEQHSYFGVVDIIAACFDDEDTDHETANDLRNVFDPNVSANSDDDEFFEDLHDRPLKRSFTVRTRKGCEVIDLLTINKRDLFHMRNEFAEIFGDLFHGAVSTLQKMVTLKLYAMELCNNQLEEAMADGREAPEYDIHVLTNRRVEAYSHEELIEFTESAKDLVQFEQGPDQPEESCDDHGH